MTKDTSRDKIWHAALEVARDRARESSRYRRRFELGDVKGHIDADVTDRTVRDTVRTMVEKGELSDDGWQGKYGPPEWMVEAFDALEDQQADDGPQTGESAPESGHTRSGPATSSTAPTAASGRESGPTRADEVAVSLEGEPTDVDGAADALEEDVDGDDDRDLRELVEDVDLPGEGEVLEQRRDAVAECLRYLYTEKQATKSDFIGEVYDEHPAGYGSSGGWWNAIGPAVREVATEREDLSPPGGEGAHNYQYTGSA